MAACPGHTGGLGTELDGHKIFRKIGNLKVGSNVFKKDRKS